jgi:ubiquinone biosynthesis protein COQ9
MTIDDMSIEDRLLLAVLPNVAFDGWTDRALAMAAEMLDMDAAAARRVFPGGAGDLVAQFSDWADRQMLVALAAQGDAFHAMKVREKITLAVRTRLEILEPHKEAVRRATTVLALPSNAALAARLLYRTVDRMWDAAGDTASDINRYTKRGLLAAVQSSTTFYWLADRSEGHEATWAFLDRRIADVLAVGRRVGRLSRLGRVLEAPFRVAARIRHRVRRAG